MKVFYEVWGKEPGSTEKHLIFKFPLGNESEQEMQNFSEAAARQMGLTEVEIKRVEQ